MPSLLLVLESSDRVVIPLDRTLLTIGRMESNDICLPHGTVSKEHATIVLEDGHWVVCDIGSTNGTYVNGERVKQCVLKHQDIVHFGEYRFFVDLEDGRPWSGSGIVAVPEMPETPLKDFWKPVTPFGGMGTPSPGMTMVLAPSSAQKIIPEKRGPDYAFWSFIMGCLAPLCPFIPIILGHMAVERGHRSRLYRRLGLFFGYFSLVLWIAALAYYAQRLHPHRNEPAPPAHAAATQPPLPGR